MSQNFPAALNILTYVATVLGADDSVQAINTDKLPGRALIACKANNSLYMLRKESTTAPSGTDIILPANGIGRWFLYAPGSDLVQPFRATYYVDPTFTGTSTGSQSNPFTTAAAAFAAAIAAGYSGATLFLPPATTLTENIVFPATGGFWEISCTQSMISRQDSLVARIVGTITVTSAVAITSVFGLTNLLILGNISGNSSAGSALLNMNNVRQNGTITTTVSGTGIWLGNFKGSVAVSPNKQGGSCTGHVSIFGAILATNWVFEGGITEGGNSGTTNPPFSTVIHDCQLGSVTGVAVPINLNSSALHAQFWCCTFAGPTTFTAASANYSLFLDGASLASVMRVGMTLVGTNLNFKTLNANASDLRTLTSNLGSTAFGDRNPGALYEVVFDQTLLVAGTTGSLQLNVTYTDMTGTLVTEPVGSTLNIAAAVGTKNRGSLVFRHNGAAAPIAFSYTGIVTPGAMSVAASVALMCRS